MHQHEIIELLLACLQQHPEHVDRSRLASLISEDWQRLLALATEQRIEALLYHRLKEWRLIDETPPEVATALRQAYRRTARYNLWLQHELGRMATVLQQIDVPLVVLKGLFLATVVYPDFGLRQMNDIDIMVPRGNLQAAKHSLMSLGYRPLKAGAVDTDMAVFHHLGHLVIADMTAVEVHWNITLPDQRHSIDPEELWQRVIPVQIAGTNVLGLAPEDLLLHICLHTSYQHQFAFGLRPFCDIAEVIKRYGDTLAWEVVLQRAEQWRWGRGVYLALRLAAELVGSAVPQAVLIRLKPAAFDEAVVDIAKAQILGGSTFSHTMTPSFSQLWQRRGLWNKAGWFIKRICLPRVELAQLYGVRPNSKALFLYYIVRTAELIIRNSHRVWAQRNNRQITEYAERQHVIAEWLAVG